MAFDDVILETEEKMEKALAKISEDFTAIRTGKASPALVENIKVDCYGSIMRMREVAGITTPEPRLIVIQPWDVSNVDAVRKSLEDSNLGVNPMVDGKLIRIPLPDLSEERRKELVKLVKKMAEDGKVSIRHARKDGMDGLKKLQKDSEITEDDLKGGESDVQKLTDKYVAQIDSAVADKEKEILTV